MLLGRKIGGGGGLKVGGATEDFTVVLVDITDTRLVAEFSSILTWL